MQNWCLKVRRTSLKILRLLTMLLVVLLVSGCTSVKQDDFAIYLFKNKTLIETLASTPARIELEDKPFISTQDIISYSKETHEIELTDDALEKVRNLDVPIKGRPFAVCLGQEIIYTGAFWTPISSIGFNGIIIMKPLAKSEYIQLEPGYPSESFYNGDDPRNNPRILECLQRSGKLK